MSKRDHPDHACSSLCLGIQTFLVSIYSPGGGGVVLRQKIQEKSIPLCPHIFMFCLHPLHFATAVLVTLTQD